jgi:competence protein ComEC
VGALALWLYLARRPAPPPEPIPSPAEPALVVRVLDVGQGDAILIETPGGKFVLVDTGPPEARASLLAALQSAGVARLDLLVATHPHLDHVGNAVRVLGAVEVGRVLDSGQPHSTRTYERTLTAIKRGRVPLTLARTGQQFELDSGIRLDVLGPPRPYLRDAEDNRELNANSVILRVTHGDFRMLLMADAEEETEETLLAHGEDLSAHVLKVAHHGSRYASSAAFLARVGPEAAIVSCGSGNEYNHPAQETLDRLRSAGARVYRTDLQGTITVRSDGRAYAIEPDRQSADAALWSGGEESDGREEGGRYTLHR